MKIKVNSEKFNNLLTEIVAKGGIPYFAGGCVRDAMQGIVSQDIDIEVHQLQEETLFNLVTQFADKTPFIGGKSFGVIKAKIDGQDFDFSLPRKEAKNGRGHKGFDIDVDPFCGPVVATMRRDFTINAMMMHAIDGTLLDLHNGEAHLQKGKLVHVSEKFAEDPLRVLRGMKFAGRMSLSIGTSETAAMCQQLVTEFDTLSSDRVWGEFEDLCLNGKSGTDALNFMVCSGWINKFPFLNDMIGCVQDEKWHPEGDAFVHTGLVMDEMLEYCADEGIDGDRRIVLVLSAMLHDIGKPATTVLSPEGRITSARHASVGAEMVEEALTLIGAPNRFLEPVRKLVKYHMVHADKVTKSFVRRMSVKLAPATIEDLALLMRADKNGRSPAPKGPNQFAVKMSEVAKGLSLEKTPPAKLVNGRDLMELGVQAGPEMGKILAELFAAQLEGKFDTLEAGLDYFKETQKD